VQGNRQLLGMASADAMWLLARRDALGQPLPVCAAANESFKQARALGLSDVDMCAVYEVTQAGPKKAA
jgi:glyoxylate/succinic semialdehyde reductase